MKKAIVGKKIGMTQIFTEDGRLVPVTVIEAGPCTVVQTKTVETDGYEAVQHDHVDGFAQQRAFFVDVAAEDRHGADAETEGEEGLVHGAHDHGRRDLFQIRQQIERKAFLGARHHHAVAGKHDHKHQQRRHHIFGDALKAALQVEAEDEETGDDRDAHEQHIHRR